MILLEATATIPFFESVTGILTVGNVLGFVFLAGLVWGKFNMQQREQSKQGEKLDKILDQTRKTNGNIIKLEGEVKTINDRCKERLLQINRTQGEIDSVQKEVSELKGNLVKSRLLNDL